MEVAPDLLQPNRDIAELGSDRPQLRRHALQGRERAFGLCDQPGCPLALLGCDRAGRLSCSRPELGDVEELLAARPKVVLVAGAEAFGPLDQRFELHESSRDRAGVASELLVTATGREQLAPGKGRVAPPHELLGTDERIERFELERGTCEAALLELARTWRSGARPQSRDPLARPSVPTRTRACGRHRRRAGRARGLPRLRAGAPRARRRPRRRRTRPARRARLRRTPRFLRLRSTSCPHVHREGDRSPGRRSSSPLRSHPSRRSNPERARGPRRG